MKDNSKLKRLIDEYRSSLKPPETEEIVNQVINRPLAFLVAKGFQRLKRNPNFITLWSMVFGVSSGYFFYRGSYEALIAAAFLLEMMIIFDCADGQLARMTGKSSKFGKTLDGLADLMTHISIFYGIALGIYIKTGHLYPFILAILSHLTFYLHIILYDHFKNVFIHVTRPDYVDKVETPEELKEKIKKDIEKYGKNSIKVFISKLYYYFYRIEYWAVSIGYPSSISNFYDLFPDPSVIDEGIRSRYYKEMRVSVKLWSFIGDTTHLTFFIIFALSNQISLLFPFMILATNLYMVIVIIYQRFKFNELGLEREAFIQREII